MREINTGDIKNQERSKLRNIITGAAFLLLVFGFVLANILYAPPAHSASERRPLATFTPPTWESVFDKKFMTEFDENYSMDSFFARDKFREIKAHVQFDLLGLLDSGGIFFADGHVSKLEELNESSVSGAAEKFAKLISRYLSGMNVYYSVIPDKNYYIAEKNGYPAMDYEKLLSLLSEELTEADYIDIFGELGADSYYTTDLHWDQAQIAGAAKALLDFMGSGQYFDGGFNVKSKEGFYGVYRGQAALPMAADTMYYLENDAVINAIVKRLDVDSREFVECLMYEIDAFGGIDPYDLFLSGAQPLITIENPLAENEKQLYIFRDSYTSSLAPLLTSAYSKITLIDLRYIADGLLEQFISFEEGSDVLFLYGTMLLNSSDTLLVK